MNFKESTRHNFTVSFISESDLLGYAEKVVDKYVYTGIIPSREKEDVMMSVVEKFLYKQDKIASSYSGNAKPSTYCIAVLNRMCCEVIRKQLVHWKFHTEEKIKEGQSSVVSSSEKLVIQDEVRLLDKILRMVNEEKDKIMIFMAYFFHLEPNKDILRRYATNSYKSNLLKILNPDSIESKSHLFENLARVTNICENKKIKADAVRMWLNKTMDKIIERLNGPFKRANYDKESLRTLFEYYYISNRS